MEELKRKVDLLTAEVADFNSAVQHSASRRSALALAVAVAAVFGLLVVAVVFASVEGHRDCLRGNEMRAAIVTSDRVSTGSFISVLAEVVSAGRTPEQQARTQAQAEAIRAGLEADPTMAQARHDLRPRSCSYLPF